MQVLPKSVDYIRATWLDADSNKFLFYRDIEGSIEHGPDRLDFDLRCTHGDDGDFSASLVESSSSLRLRFDGTHGPEDLVMRRADSADELIFWHESLRQVIYLHVGRR